MSKSADHQTSPVEALVRRMEAALRMLLNLEHQKPAAPGDSVRGLELVDMRWNCVMALAECYKETEGLRKNLASVWTPEVAQEVADLRTSIKTLQDRLAMSGVNGFNHPHVLVASNAAQDWKDDWISHERRLRFMVRRLRALDLPPPPAKREDSAASEQMTWQAAKVKAEAHCARNGFPGVRSLAKIVGCSPATMSKAIQNSTALKARQAEVNQARKRIKINRLNDIKMDGLEQRSEADPRDAAIGRLVAEQQADMRNDEQRSIRLAVNRSTL